MKNKEELKNLMNFQLKDALKKYLGEHEERDSVVESLKDKIAKVLEPYKDKLIYQSEPFEIKVSATQEEIEEGKVTITLIPKTEEAEEFVRTLNEIDKK